MADNVIMASPSGSGDFHLKAVDSKYQTWSRGLRPGSTAEVHREFDAAARLSSDSYVDLGYRPKFIIPKNSKFFTIGSCFARNIEVVLQTHCFDVLSLKISLPEAALQNHKHAAGVLTKFNTFSMLNEVRAALVGARLPDDGLIELEPNLFWDSQLHHVPLLDLATAKLVREEVYRTFRTVAEADVCIVTLGLTEMWWDKINNAALNDAPVDWRHAKRTNRFEFRNPDFEALKQNVFELCGQIFESSGRRIKIILTVSPVPLQRTFSGRDVIIANSYSKAALRAVADCAWRELEYVDYYPSFEFVQNTPRHLAWEHDQRHVKYDLVRYITERFIELCIEH